MQVGNRRDQALRVGVLRVAEKGARRAQLHDAPGVHDAEAVGDLRQQRHVMADEQHGGADGAARGGQRFQDDPLGDDVEGAGRLIRDDQARPQQQRQRDTHALPHAAAQLMRIARQNVRFQAHALQGLGEARAHGCRLAALAMRGQGVHEMFLQPHDGIERAHRPLGDVGKLSPAQFAQGALVELEQIPVIEAHPSGDHLAGRTQQAQDAEREGALAAAAFPGQAQHLVASQLQVHAIHGANGRRARRVMDAQPFDAQDRAAILQRRGGPGLHRVSRRGLAIASSAVLTKNRPMKRTMRMRIGGSHHHQRPSHIALPAMAK